MTLRVPTVISEATKADWSRKVATAVNQLITGKQDVSVNLTSIAGLSLTGNSGEVIAVKATEDGFELVSAGGGGSLADGDKGDVTVSGTGAVWTVDNDAITYAKIQNVSATDKLLGRSTAGAGDVEEIACTAAGRALLDDANAAAQLVTLGAAGSGAVTGSGLTMATARLLGRTTTSTGAIEEISVSGLTLSGGVLSSGGRLIWRQIITATGAGTYTPTAGTNSIIIEMVGGGGGGAGTISPTGTNSSRAGSGGGGAYLRKRLTSGFSGASYVVGVKGTGGSAGANNGNDGADTTFNDGSTTYTAGKGLGGVSFSVQSTTRSISGGVGGAATNGDLNIPGGAAQPSMVCTGNVNCFSGNGGTSLFSTGGASNVQGSVNASSAGNNAGGYGGGGSGAAANGTGAAAAGGDGSDGLIIIWEYS